MKRMMWMMVLVFFGCSPGLDGPELLYPEWVAAHTPFEIEIVDPVDGATFTYWWSLDYEPRSEFTGPMVNQTKDDPEDGTWRVVVQQEIDEVLSSPSDATIEIRVIEADEEPEEETSPESVDNDGDGVPVFSDCDDEDAANMELKGSSESCPLFDCLAVGSVHDFVEQTPETGPYWMKCETDGVSAYQMLCDFDAEDGPWGLVLTTDGYSPNLSHAAAGWQMPNAESGLFTTDPLIRLGNTDRVATKVSYGAANIPVNELRFCVLNDNPVCVATSFDAGSTLWGAASGEGFLESTEGEVFLGPEIEQAVLDDTPELNGFWRVQADGRYPRIGFQGVDLDDVIGEFGVGFAVASEGDPDPDPDSDSTDSTDSADTCSAGMVTRPRGGDDGHYCYPVSIWLK